MKIKGINFITEGTKYTLFENLNVNKEIIIFIPQRIEFDNSLRNEYLKLTYFLKPVC